MSPTQATPKSCKQLDNGVFSPCLRAKDVLLQKLRSKGL